MHKAFHVALDFLKASPESLIKSKQSDTIPSLNQKADLSRAESRNDLEISKQRRGQAFSQVWNITRVVLPTDTDKTKTGDSKGIDGQEDIRKAQAARQASFYRSSSPSSVGIFMIDPNALGRQQNYGMQSMMRQRQLVPPNSNSQFYAFMHAMAAGFGRQ